MDNINPFRYAVVIDTVDPHDGSQESVYECQMCHELIEDTEAHDLNAHWPPPKGND